MAVRKSKKAVFFANEPFRVSSYLRSVTDDLVSRFGSAEQGQTNLDLLKSETQKSFRGGMFQRIFDDPEKVSSVTGAYFNKLDDNLYPTPNWPVIHSAADMGEAGVTSWCYFKGDFFIAFRKANPPNTGKNDLIKYDPDTELASAVTLPVGLEGGDALELCVFESNIFIAAKATTSTGTTAYRFNGVSTFTSVSGNFSAFVPFNNKLYGIDTENKLQQIVNPTATPLTWTEIDTIGPHVSAIRKSYHDNIDFNNARYIAMDSGLYRFDGTKVHAVLDYSKAVDANNFRHLAVFNGRLYYDIKNKLFQFDGTNIEQMQDFSDGYKLNDLVGGADRLWVSTTVDTGVPYSDRFTNVTTYNHSVFCYDGVGFFEYHDFETEIPVAYMQLSLIPVSNKIFAFVPDIYLNESLEPRSDGYNLYVLHLADEFTTTHAGSGFTVTSSAMDNGYPSVVKAINGLMLNYGGVTGSEASFKLELQYLLNGTWSEWSEVWNTSNVGAGGATNDYLLHEQVKLDTSPLLDTIPETYHRLRFRVICELSDSTPTTLPYLSDVSMRYTIQPRFRMKWLLTLDLTGSDTRSISTPTSPDGFDEDRSATYLRKILYDAYRNKKPILFYDVDWTEVKDDSPLKVNGVDFIVPGDTIAVQDAAGNADPWINRRVDGVTYDEVDDETSLTLASFGYRVGIGGSSNTTLEVGAQVRKSYAVEIKDIRNERVIIDDNTLNDNAGRAGYTDIPSQITIDVIEV